MLSKKTYPPVISLLVGLLLAPSLAVAQPATQPADLALLPPTINFNPGPEFADDARDFNMIIGMDRSPGGRIWACYAGGGDSELAHFIIKTSEDRGETWSKPRLVVNHVDPTKGVPRRSLVGNLWTDPKGRLWLFFDQAIGYFDGRAGAWAIVCDNPDAEKPTWSEPRRIWHGCTLNKPTVLKNGDWLMPISLWRRGNIHALTEKKRPSTDPKLVPAGFNDQFKDLDELRKAHAFRSSNQGHTWERLGGVEFPKFNFDEHMMVELKDGRIWMLARTGDGLFESYSSDQGKTWSEPKLRFPNVAARFFLRRLASGKLLLIKHGRIDEKTKGRSHLTALLSDDDGQTWKGELVLDERNGVSYPDGFESPDGMIFILYDHNRYTDAEILMARFTEHDMMAGKFQSPGAKEKMVVSKATKGTKK